MRNHLRGTLLVSAGLLMAAHLAAQTTGTIQGTIRDASGGVLPGVSIEARSAALQGSKTAVSGRDGGYRIVLLPPGNYVITFALSGFGRTQKTAEVFLDKTVVVDASLQLSAKEEVIVTGEAPVIDSTSSGTGANFTAEFVRTLPIGRGFQAVATKAPGVIQGFGSDSTNFNVQGSTGAENSFMIDGVDTTEIQYGRQGKAAPSEFIQEVEVKVGGYQAEYGHAQGGVLNAITKQGGNDFHGDGFGYYSGRPNGASGGDLWQASDRHLQEKADSRGTVRSQTDPIRNTLRGDYGLDLGGFAWKDRMWFFGAYDRVHSGGENFLNNPVGNCASTCNAGPGTGTVTNETTATITNQDLYAGKLTFRVSDSISLVGSVFGDPSTTGPNLATPLSGADPGTYRGTTKQGGADYTGRLSGILGARFLFELQGARHNEKTNQAPEDVLDRNFITVTPSGVPPTGGFGFYRTQDFYRNYFRGAASLYADLLGAHEFKAGGDYAQVASDSKRVYTGGPGNKETVFVYRFKEGTVYQHEYNSSGLRNAAGDPIEVDLAPGGTLSRSTNTGVFVQDKWQVLPTLTLNLGVRWEDQKIKDINNVTQIHVNDEWMPRVGFAWDFLGGGKSRLYGSYSRFYETMPTDINIRAYGLEITTAVYNFDPNSDHGDPAACGVRFTPIGGTTANTRVCSAGRQSTIKTGGSFGEPTQPGIKGQYSDGITFGVQYQPVTDLSLGVEFNYRSLGRVIEDGGSVNANGDLEYFIFNPGTTFTSPDTGATVGSDFTAFAPRRFYRAMQLTAQKRFSNRLQFLASYVYSKLEGNYDGVFQTSTTQLDPNINSAYDYPIFLQNARGYLSNDRRHTFKLDGSYVAPFGVTVGLSAFYFTGTPLNKYGYYNDYRNYELYLAQRGSVGRTPDIYDADVHLAYGIPLGAAQLNVGADVFNVLNLQRTLAQDQRFDLSGGDPPGVNPGPANPNYLRPISFTGRRSLRVFGRVSF
jgi:hypothetical protein